VFRGIYTGGRSIVGAPLVGTIHEGCHYLLELELELELETVKRNESQQGDRSSINLRSVRVTIWWRPAKPEGCEASATVRKDEFEMGGTPSDAEQEEHTSFFQ